MRKRHRHNRQWVRYEKWGINMTKGAGVMNGRSIHFFVLCLFICWFAWLIVPSLFVCACVCCRVSFCPVVWLVLCVILSFCLPVLSGLLRSGSRVVAWWAFRVLPLAECPLLLAQKRGQKAKRERDKTETNRNHCSFNEYRFYWCSYWIQVLFNQYWFLISDMVVVYLFWLLTFHWWMVCLLLVCLVLHSSLSVETLSFPFLRSFNITGRCCCWHYCQCFFLFGPLCLVLFLRRKH